MNRWMTAAAILALGIAAAFQAQNREGTKDRPLPSPLHRVEVDRASSAPPDRSSGRTDDPGPLPVRTEAPPKLSAKEPPSWRKLRVVLERDLSLTAAQRASIERILLEREREIREYHDFIRTSMVLNLADYEWWAADRKSARSASTLRAMVTGMSTA